MGAGVLPSSLGPLPEGIIWKALEKSSGICITTLPLHYTLLLPWSHLGGSSVQNTPTTLRGRGAGLSSGSADDRTGPEGGLMDISCVYVCVHVCEYTAHSIAVPHRE